MNIGEVYALLVSEVARIEQEIQGNLHSRVARVKEIGEYIFSSGGKRLRPLLVLLACKQCEGSVERAIRIGGVVEYIHTATLLHDDVIDEASLRRGRHSANFAFGNPAVILVGDYLYSKAFEVLVADGDQRIQQTLSKVTTLMSEGEVFQLVKSFDFGISLEDYFNIIEHKTAILIAACAQCGGYTGNADEATAQALWDYGYNLGMAFQIIDDILDYMGDTGTLGKSIGTDLREGKMTIPLLKLRDAADSEERAQLQAIVERHEPPTSEELAFVIRLMEQYDIRQQSLAVGQSFIDRSRQAAGRLHDNQYRTAMLSVCDYVLERQR